MIGLLNPAFVALLGRASVTPAQALVAAWTSRGMSGIILADDLVNPVADPGSIVSHLDGITYTAQSAAGTPLLVPAGGDGPNGRAYLRANGINQTLIGGTAETVDTYIAVFRSPPGQTTWQAPAGILENATGTSPRLGIFQSGNTDYNEDNISAPREVSRNGVSLAAFYPLAPITEYMIVSVATHSPNASLVLGLFTLGGVFFGAADLVALGKWSTAPTSDQISGAESDASIYTGIALAA